MISPDNRLVCTYGLYGTDDMATRVETHLLYTTDVGYDFDNNTCSPLYRSESVRQSRLHI